MIWYVMCFGMDKMTVLIYIRSLLCGICWNSNTPLQLNFIFDFVIQIIPRGYIMCSRSIMYVVSVPRDEIEDVLFCYHRTRRWMLSKNNLW